MKRSSIHVHFEKFAERVTKKAGSTAAFLLAAGMVLGWAASGAFFRYSEDWKWSISIGTAVITFLMVFLIQKSQNKDSLAIQLKLNEILAADRHASNRLVDLESMSEEEMETIRKYYRELARAAQEERHARQAKSIDVGKQDEPGL